MNCNRLLILSLTLFVLVRAHGQFYPTQATTQLIPPYSVYLSDYATPGTEKLRVILLQKDLTQPSYQLRLIMTVEWNGRVIMRTSRAYNPAPINLSPGIPTIISGAELAPYLDSRNIDFVGYSRDQYERTRALPEGSYQITFTAYDYRRQDVQVSNAGASFYYLAKSEPPLINFPACGTKIAARTPQQIIFSWLSRNTSSPNSAGRTVYEFSLYETRPAGRNPNDVVLSSQPVFTTRTEQTQLFYGPAEPMLLENMNYVWRIRATDENGRDAFRNNGYSEVCTFTYGGVDPTFNVGIVQNLQAVGESERRGTITWNHETFDTYKIYYKKSGNSYEWFSSEITKASLDQKGATEGELKLYDLEPDTEYETRAHGKKNGVAGPYTEIIKFRTMPFRVAQCGDPAIMPEGGPGNPFLNPIMGTIIEVDGFEMSLVDIESSRQDGWYKGHGRISIPYLGGASFMVKFDNIFINEDHKAVLGRIDFVTKGVAALIEQQIAEKKKTIQQKKERDNRSQWAGVQFHDKMFTFSEIAIDTVYTGPDNTLVVIDESGQTIPIPEIPPILKNAEEKAIIIEDKNGDQWVVQKEGKGYKTTKVPGGGLQPNGNVPISVEAVNVVKKALRELRQTYDDNAIQNIESDLLTKRSSLQKVIKENNSKIIPSNTTSTTNTNSQSLFFDFVEVQGVATNDEFSKLSILVKQKELEFNRAALIRFISRDLDRKDDYKLIARELKINNKVVSEFVAAEKVNNTSDAQITDRVKQEIVAFIDQVFINYSNTRK